ncbi:DNA adenine methylase [Candidatus Parcubacteria bacterium]|nr:DNA adenine methylase [Candidatus Parcubacteria bacterium]
MVPSSPLRYPGGKAFLSSRFSKIIENNGLRRPVYIEPFAGGAGAALSLLFSNKVRKIVINDLDYCIYSFWYSVVNHNRKFINKILSTPITIDEWKIQKQIYKSSKSKIFERGFATFFLNRTNAYGIINANPIGGIKQNGKYKIDARFNKKGLIDRIQRIAKFKSKIVVSNEDGLQVFKRYSEITNTFIYLDPPYFAEGYALYLNVKDKDYHNKLAKTLNKSNKAHWVLTYDENRRVRDLYSDRNRNRLSFKYRTTRIRNARELMVYSDSLVRI